jgi:hypothetical protein
MMNEKLLQLCDTLKRKNFLTKKGNFMNKITEQEFKQALDQLVTAGLNSLDVSVVYGQLSITKQFVEVVYDTNVVNYLEQMKRQQAIAAEAARQLEAQQAANDEAKAKLSLVPQSEAPSAE